MVKVIHVKSKDLIVASIEEVTHAEIDSIKKSGEFEFDWSLEMKHTVFKLYLKEPDGILGLMSIIDWPDELRIEIHLLESSAANIGKDKIYENIAGCLIAYACGISFDRGYLGFISLVPKTNLRKYYMAEYGMENGGVSIFSDTKNSARLMNKYL